MIVSLLCYCSSSSYSYSSSLSSLWLSMQFRVMCWTMPCLGQRRATVKRPAQQRQHALDCVRWGPICLPDVLFLFTSLNCSPSLFIFLSFCKQVEWSTKRIVARCQIGWEADSQINCLQADQPVSLSFLFLAENMAFQAILVRVSQPGKEKKEQDNERVHQDDQMVIE